METMTLHNTIKAAITEQANALSNLSEQVSDEFVHAAELMYACKGRVIISGMGKSGLIGKKIAATLASTGTRSFFMHPAEAYHGDLGMVRYDDMADLVVLISYSGETDEVLKLIPPLKRFGNRIVAITGGLDSTLARNANIVLDASVDSEICPHNLAPTTSTTAALVIGDALAVALMKLRDFQPEEFANYHPGGSLGRRLLTKVRDMMVSDNLPFVQPESSMSSVIVAMTESRTGVALVTEGGLLRGVITDGDLRRYLLSHKTLEGVFAKDLMSENPVCINENALLVKAENLMKDKHIKWLIALNEEEKVIGLLEWAA
ncbi:KpsF/GutQ family sugar-phosphate isomerase [Endozoicomonas sp. Mp262]|uniref:KpsF/GutQ family sugar-phosphate isomerase n=1 Tax=Endozoicomonas sp. Mp262 TaxID=2919499 RepID=UPI0021DA9FB1